MRLIFLTLVVLFAGAVGIATAEQEPTPACQPGPQSDPQFTAVDDDDESITMDRSCEKCRTGTYWEETCEDLGNGYCEITSTQYRAKWCCPGTCDDLSSCYEVWRYAISSSTSTVPCSGC